jgi:hypothetical protein
MDRAALGRAKLAARARRVARIRRRVAAATLAAFALAWGVIAWNGSMGASTAATAQAAAGTSAVPAAGSTASPYSTHAGSSADQPAAGAAARAAEEARRRSSGTPLARARRRSRALAHPAAGRCRPRQRRPRQGPVL